MEFDNSSLAKYYGMLASRLDISPMVIGPQQHKIRHADDAVAYYSSNGSMRNFGGRMVYRNTRAILELLLDEKPESLDGYNRINLSAEVNRRSKLL
jgi:hypothetical protein